MLYTYQECLDLYNNDYQIKKAMRNGVLFQIEKGLYSDSESVTELEIISKKYPHAIFTRSSAFYYHGLTDVIPDYYCLATSGGSRKITDSRVRQVFENCEEWTLGAMTLSYGNSRITVYNKERMLIELIRNRSKIPYEQYKEIIQNYRKEIYEMDIALIAEYAYKLPKSKKVMEVIRLEVL